MKLCTRCKDLRPLTLFSINDYGRPSSWCKECTKEATSARYYKKKLALLENKMSEGETVSESENKERKCKDFFFYA